MRKVQAMLDDEEMTLVTGLELALGCTRSVAIKMIVRFVAVDEHGREAFKNRLGRLALSMCVAGE